MLRFRLVLQLLLSAMSLYLLLPWVALSGTADSTEEICDVDADFALGIEDYPSAIRLHREVLRAHKGNALAHYHLGFAYGMAGRTTDELNEYLTAATLGLRKWDLFVNLGIAYGAENDWHQAAKAFQVAASLGPDHPEPHFNLAIADEKLNRRDEAEQEIMLSERLTPSAADEVDSTTGK